MNIRFFPIFLFTVFLFVGVMDSTPSLAEKKSPLFTQPVPLDDQGQPLYDPSGNVYPDSWQTRDLSQGSSQQSERYQVPEVIKTKLPDPLNPQPVESQGQEPVMTLGDPQEPVVVNPTTKAAGHSAVYPNTPVYVPVPVTNSHDSSGMPIPEVYQ